MFLYMCPSVKKTFPLMHQTGGVRADMYSDLPRPLRSKSGFQGCFASFETNGELLDPVRHALVPSSLVEEGCEGKNCYFSGNANVCQRLFSRAESVAFEWPSLKKGGVVRYTYPADKRPDTNSDLLSLVHIHHFDAKYQFFSLLLIHILQGFITPSFDAVLARIDSHPSEGASPSSSSSADGGEGAADNGAANDKRDFLELSIVSFFVFLTGNFCYG